eukprot:13587226-Ditylum_brightwellii.AAC.1
MRLKWSNNTKEEEIDHESHIQPMLRFYYQGEDECEDENVWGKNEGSNYKPDIGSAAMETALSSSIIVNDYDNEEMNCSSADTMYVPFEEIFIVQNPHDDDELSNFMYSVAPTSEDEEDYSQDIGSSFFDNSSGVRERHEMNVNHIVSIGFSIAAAERALERAKDNAKLAVQLLMDGKVPFNTLCTNYSNEQQKGCVSDSTQSLHIWEDDACDESSIDLNNYDGCLI